jgi:prefoldin subunit 5
MSSETETMAQLETIEMRLRSLRQRVASLNPKTQTDARVLEKQISELKTQANTLKERLNPKPKLVAK